MNEPQTDPGAGGIRWFGVVLLAGHLGLLLCGAASLWTIAGWWLGALLTLIWVLGYIIGWRRLAPGSLVRLGYRPRLAVTVVLGAVVVTLGAFAGLWLPALIATSFVLIGDALNGRGVDPVAD